MSYTFVSFCNCQYDAYQLFLQSISQKFCHQDIALSPEWWASSKNITSYAFLAYKDNEVVSRCVTTERVLEYKRKEFKCLEVGGVFTLPSHRGKGLFLKLLKEATQSGFEKRYHLLFATPNERSGPGFKKLGWSFADSRTLTSLVLVPNGLNPVLRKFGLIQRAIRCIQEVKAPSLKVSISREISSEEYIKTTIGFPRMNCSNANYLERRIGKHHRCFLYQEGCNEFYCCICQYDLAYLKLLIVGEYYLNGMIDKSFHKFRYLKYLCNTYYRNYDGIYLDSHTNTYLPRWATFARYGYVPHRTLPIYYIDNGATPKANQIITELSKSFQLTDCDIG